MIENKTENIRKVESRYIYLSFGTNTGNRKKNILKALSVLKGYKGITVIKTSTVYESNAWGYTKQKAFYNSVVKIETNIPPKKLLSVCKKIEKRMKRVKKFKWGPRIIDIDILIYKRLKIYTKNLTIPHKYITQRIFVVVPLAEIDKNIRLNGQKLDYFIDRFNEELKSVDE